MAQPKVTPWFPAIVKPVHVGWYDTGHAKTRVPQRRRFWNGSFFENPWWPGEASCFGDGDSDIWRGLSKPVQTTEEV